MEQGPFVFTEVFGGLGNQLFQYAAAFMVAKLNNALLYVRPDGNNDHNIKKHNYVKRLFIDAEECVMPEESFTRYNQQLSPFFPWNPLEVKVPVRMEGYFQYYPAIEPCLPLLVERLRQALCVNETTQDVFLHIRRGDYVEKREFHYLQGPEYYAQAYLQLIEKLQKLPERVVLFSDDIEWCKQQDWIRSIPSITFYESDDEIETLRAMATCGGGAIIANSTYSWWGAILSKTEHVYYPSRWIGCKVFDLFPKNWVCI
jgi:hypothetical protein